MQYQTIRFERREHIGILSLNRPHRMNAFTNEMLDELTACFDSLCKDLRTRVVILRGDGTAFCAGHDLHTIEADLQSDELGEPQGAYQGLGLASDLILSMRRAPQPVIAAVRGPAVGGAFSIALACDVRIAAESARFNAAFVLIGGSGGDMGSSYFLPRLVGLSNASEYLYTGDFIDAPTALRIGLVSRVVPDAELDETAIALAERMLRSSPMGLRMTKELLNVNAGSVTLEEAIHLENRTNALISLTEDYKDGPRAFMEKRRPVWKDK